MRAWPGPAGFVAAALMLGLAPAGAADQTLHLKLGKAAVVTLTENPSTGYRWQIDRAASRNLAIVLVVDRGFTAGHRRGMVGAPGLRQFRITARAPGTAEAAFAYARPWEAAAPAQRHVVAIDISR